MYKFNKLYNISICVVLNPPTATDSSAHVKEEAFPLLHSRVRLPLPHPPSTP